jgi:quinohemoprotein ethanol dehydrogenase
VLATAGNLVFQGTAAGEFSAYVASSGEKVWSFPAQEGIVAPPVSYAVRDEQYVLVAVGWGGVFPLLAGEIAKQGSASGKKGRLLAFKLGGRQMLPVSDVEPRVANIPKPFGDAALVADGKVLYHRFCGGCHGDAAVSGGVLPDLRRSGATHHMAAWSAIVRDGALQARGMVSFAKELTAENAEAIRAYVTQRANEDPSLVPPKKH